MELGLTGVEVAQKWNATLNELQSVLARPELPHGMAEAEYLAMPGHIRVPEADPTKYSTYRAYVDMAAAVAGIVLSNNERITEQLRSIGVELR
jgi:hypothetical protein